MSIEDYVAAFRRRNEAVALPGQLRVEEPGVTGLLGEAPDGPWGRLLVTDDRALDLLVARGPELRARPITVLDTAPACGELLAGTGRYDVEVGSAMVCDDLDLPELALPEGLELRPVRRAADDDPGGVPLEQAAAACLRAEEDGVLPPFDAFVAFLRGLPTGRFLAAVDQDGEVRATAGSLTFGGDALVIFVSTDRDWRGQGLGTSMTAAALRVARSEGAEQACLDASALGRGIYLRLGFSDVGGIRRFIARGEERPAAGSSAGAG